MLNSLNYLFWQNWILFEYNWAHISVCLIVKNKVRWQLACSRQPFRQILYIPLCMVNSWEISSDHTYLKFHVNFIQILRSIHSSLVNVFVLDPGLEFLSPHGILALSFSLLQSTQLKVSTSHQAGGVPTIDFCPVQGGVSVASRQWMKLLLYTPLRVLRT